MNVFLLMRSRSFINLICGDLNKMAPAAVFLNPMCQIFYNTYITKVGSLRNALTLVIFVKVARLMISLYLFKYSKNLSVIVRSAINALSFAPDE